MIDYSLSVFEGTVDLGGAFEVYECPPGLQPNLLQTGAMNGGRFTVDAEANANRTVVVRSSQVIRLPPMQYVDFNIGVDDRTFLIAQRVVEVNDLPVDMADLEAAVNGLQLDSLDTTIASNVVFVSGTGQFQGIGLGFDATILLTPEQDPCLVGVVGFPNRVIQVQVQGIDVRSTAGGIEGWLLTALLDVLIGLLGPAIRNLLANQIQQQVDVVVGGMLGDENLPPGSVVTAQSVTGGAPGTLVIDAVAAVLLERACASTFSARVAFRSGAELAFLRMMRLHYLSDSEEGRYYRLLFDHFQPELRQLMKSDLKACSYLDAVVDGLQKDFDARERRGKLSKKTAGAAAKLIRQLQSKAPKDLKPVPDGLSERLPDFVGKKPVEVLHKGSSKIKTPPKGQRQPKKR